MRGSENDPVDDDLYEGTAKSAEGHAAFGLAKEDGVNIEVNWQDADSSSANSFHKHYPNGCSAVGMLHVATVINWTLFQKKDIYKAIYK